jgi:hypothetical protein
VESFSDLFAEWRTADKAAREAEAKVLSRSMQALDGEGSLPTPEEWNEAKRLRAFANYLLETAMKKMRSEDARRHTHSRPGGDSTREQSSR